MEGPPCPPPPPQGLLSLANAKGDENDSHFSIMAAPSAHLDGKMTIFGEVVEGMDVSGGGGAAGFAGGCCCCCCQHLLGRWWRAWT